MNNLSTFVKRIRDIMRKDAGINGDAQRIEQLSWMLFLKIYDMKEENWSLEVDGYESVIPEECRWTFWATDKNLTGDSLLNFVNNVLFQVLKGNKAVWNDKTIQGIELNKVKQTKKEKEEEKDYLRKTMVKTVFEDANNYMKDGTLLKEVLGVVNELDLSGYEDKHAFAEIYEEILRKLQSSGSSGEFYTPRAVTEFMAKMIEPKIGEKMADFACGTGGFITSWLNELEKKIGTSTKNRELWGSSIYGIEKKQFPYMLCMTNLLFRDIEEPRVDHDNSLSKELLDYTEQDAFDVILMNPPYGGIEKNDIKNNFPSDVASSETADLFMSLIMQRLKKTGRAAVILPDGFLFGTDNAKVAIKKNLYNYFNLHTVIRLPQSVFSPYTSITTNILFFDHKGPTKETWFYRLDMPEGYKHFSKTKPIQFEHLTPAVEWWKKREEISVDGFDKAKKYTADEIAERSYNLDLCGYPHEEEEILPPKDLIREYQEKRASLNADIDRILAQITDILGIDMDGEDEQ